MRPATRLMSYPEFKQTHRVKYASLGLSNSEIRKRYDSYLESSRPSNAAPMRALPKPHRKNLKPQPIRSSQGVTHEQVVRMGQVAPGVDLSPSSSKYIGALVDPSDPTFIGAGYPKAGQGPSFKNRWFGRGTMTVGSKGTGFAVFSPLAGLTSDLQSVAVSTALFAGDAQFPDQFVEAPLDSPIKTFPTSSTVTKEMKGVAARIVAASIKMTPAGKVLDKSGVVTSVNTPGGVDLGSRKEAELQTEWWRHSQIHTQTAEGHKKFSALYTPTFPNMPMYDVVPESGTLEEAAVNAGSGLLEVHEIQDIFNTNLGIMITGAEPGFVYYVEAYVHGEYFVGTSPSVVPEVDNVVVQNMSPVYSDSAALDLVDSSNEVSLNSLPKTDNGNSSLSSVIGWITKAAANNSTFSAGMKSLASAAGQSVNQMTSSFTSTAPQLTDGVSLESMGGFLEASEPATDSAGPLIEMLGDNGEVIAELAGSVL